MSSKPPIQDDQAPQPPPAAPPPHRQHELPEPEPEDRRPEQFVEIDGRLVPEGDFLPTMPLPMLR